MLTQISGVAFQYSHTIGQGENTGTGFRNPIAMARDHRDWLYVVNRSHAKRITISSIDEEYIGQFGKGVSTPEEAEKVASTGPLLWPTSVALDKQGNVYVADEGLNLISIFTRDGELLDRWGKAGVEAGEINRPSGITFDENDNLYLIDSVNNRIQVFTKEGKFLSKWGQAGGRDGEFNLPWGIDIDGQGNVYVADWGNSRIQKFTDGGRFAMKFGSPGKGEGEFNRTTGVAVDTDGIIYVTDWGNQRVEVFDPDGGFITRMTGDATLSKRGKKKLDANPDVWKARAVAQGLEREKLFWEPMAVEVDDSGRVFVADTGRCRIQVYRKQQPVFLASTLGG